MCAHNGCKTLCPTQRDCAQQFRVVLFAYDRNCAYRLIVTYPPKLASLAASVVPLAVGYDGYGE